MNLRLTFAAAALAAALFDMPAAFAALSAPPTVDAAPMPSLAPMVKRVSPAVVNVATRGTIKEKPGQRNPLMDDPFFRRFSIYRRMRSRVSGNFKAPAPESS